MHMNTILHTQYRLWIQWRLYNSRAYFMRILSILTVDESIKTHSTFSRVLVVIVVQHVFTISIWDSLSIWFDILGFLFSEVNNCFRCTISSTCINNLIWVSFTTNHQLNAWWKCSYYSMFYFLHLPYNCYFASVSLSKHFRKASTRV